MDYKDTGGSAFPVNASEESNQHPHVWPETGMSLRDYFAAKALQGLLPARDEQGRTAFTELTPQHIAESAYEIADAMLEVRKA